MNIEEKARVDARADNYNPPEQETDGLGMALDLLTLGTTDFSTAGLLKVTPEMLEDYDRYYYEEVDVIEEEQDGGTYSD